MSMSLPALLALLLAAAPTAETPEERVLAIGHRLGVAGVALCPEATPRAGFTLHAIDQYDPDLRGEIAELYGMDDAPAVLIVVAESAAARAGLRAGDSIVAIDGAAPPTRTEEEDASNRRVAAIETAIEDALARGPIRLTVERGGRHEEIAITGDRGCVSRFRVRLGRRLNASADGTYVTLSTAVVDFTRSDDELALIIAHEFSHNILRHRESLDEKGVSRGLFRAFGKNPGRIRATENEADRFALHLMARAGFDINVAPAFWDRFARETDAGIFSDRTHSGRRERVAIAKAEIALIAAQRARGEPPTPGFDAASPPSSAR